jgi:ketosteroid isomerase-like protein
MGHSDTHRLLHELFNARKFDEIEAHLAPDFVFQDCARGLTMKSGAEFIEWLNGWTSSFSDAEVSDPAYVDGPDHSLCEFQARGTNDGAVGPAPATGRRIDQPFCEILHYTEDGQVRSGAMYYDQVTMLTQLGHLPPMDEPAVDQAAELESAVRRLFASFDKVDLEALKTQLASDGQGVDELSRRWMRDEETILAYFRQLEGALSSVHSELSDLHAVSYGETGVVTLWLEQDYTLDGKAQHVSAPTTVMFRRDAGEWRAVLVHSIPLPDEES